MARTSKPKPTAQASREPQHPDGTAADVPDWVNMTPDDNEYVLDMFAGGGDNAQQVTMTRTEYITLKRVLAALRGYTIHALRTAWDINHSTDEDHQKIALDITQDEIAQAMDVHRAFGVLLLSFKQRLLQGAAIEEGRFILRSDGDLEGYQKPVTGGHWDGVDIHDQQSEAAATSQG